jgi:hypothetical protein
VLSLFGSTIKTIERLEPLERFERLFSPFGNNRHRR